MMVTGDDDSRALPKLQRIIYSSIVPLFGLFGFRLLIAKLLHSNAMPWTGSALDLFVRWFLVGGLAIVFTPFLIWAAVRSALRPWRTWWSAVLGGAAATAAAYALGIFVILLLVVLGSRK
jgi:hypothetical protein